jgi:endonuclease VIII
MAEGDSILRIARRLDSALAGSAVAVRTPGRRRPDGPAERLQGATLERAHSHGKHLLLRFSGGLVLHSHLGMKGAWHIYGAGERWRKPGASAWIAISNEETEAVNFNGTTMRVLRAEQARRDPRLRQLGPDILGEDLTAAEAVAALRKAEPGTEVGDALLDQRLLAGVGNIFKSEGCFAAGIDPWRTLADLDDAELECVAISTRALMLDAVESGRQPQRVYRRAGQPCPSCRARLLSRPQGDAARVTYWCPDCQGSPRGDNQGR